MNRRIFSFLVLFVTILIANLITTLITDYFLRFRGQSSALKFTAIGMVVIVVLFYPLFEYINRLTERATARLLRKGRNLFGRILGIYIAFALVILAMYCIYAYTWFNVNVLAIAFGKLLG